MNLSFDLDTEDWVAFQKWYRMKRMPLFKWMGALMVSCVILLVLLNILLIIFKGFSALSWISALILLILGYLLFLRSKSDRKLVEAGNRLKEKNPQAFGKLDMFFDEEGFTVTSLYHTKRIKWEEMDKNEENKDYCFLFSKKGLVYIIPKSKAGKDLKDFYTLLDEHLN